jgi:exonuclease VII small subunit
MNTKYNLFFNTIFFLLLNLCYTRASAQHNKDSLLLSADFESFIQKKTEEWQVPFQKNQWSDLTHVLGLDALSVTKMLNHPKATLRIENFWNTGDSVLYGDAANTTMTYVSPEIQVDVLGIPIAMLGNVVLKGQHFEKSLSTFRVQFDYYRFLEQKKQAFHQKILQQTIHQWTDAEKKCWANKAKWDALYPIANHPEFRKNKQHLNEMIDSLENLPTTMTGKAKDHLASLKKESQKYQAIEQSFNQLKDYYRQYNKGMQEAEKLKERVQTAEKQAEQGLADLKNTGKTVEKHKNQWIQSYLGRIKGLDIGTFDVMGSELTLRNMTMNGAHIAVQANKIYAEAAFGKQNTATPIYRMGFNPIYGAGDLNRRVLYLRSGIGNPDSAHLHLSVTRIMDDFKNATLTNPQFHPKYNDVVALSGRQPLAKGVDLTAEFAYSIFRSDVVQGWGIRQDFSQQTNASQFDFSAFQLQMGSAPFAATDWRWSLGYTYIGNQFITLGNPFLMNNRQLIRGEIQKSLIDNRLQIKMGFDKQFAAGASTMTPTIDQTGWRVEGAFKYGRSHRFSVQIMPRYYLLSASGSPNAIGRYDIYNIQNTLQGRIGKARWLSFVNLTNMNLMMPIGDTVRFTGLNYVFTQNRWMPSDKWTFSMTGNIGLEGTFRNLRRREAMLQADLRWQQKKVGLSIGTQILGFSTLHPRLESQMGGLLGCSLKLRKGSFGFQSQVRARLGGDGRPYTFSGQSFLNFNLN